MLMVKNMTEEKIKNYAVYNDDKDTGEMSLLFDEEESEVETLLLCECGQYSFIEGKTCPSCDTTFSHFSEI